MEPTLIKENLLNDATEAACSIISVDQIVKNPKEGTSYTRLNKRWIQKAIRLKPAKK